MIYESRGYSPFGLPNANYALSLLQLIALAINLFYFIGGPIYRTLIRNQLSELYYIVACQRGGVYSNAGSLQRCGMLSPVSGESL